MIDIEVAGQDKSLRLNANDIYSIIKAFWVMWSVDGALVNNEKECLVKIKNHIDANNINAANYFVLEDVFKL